MERRHAGVVDPVAAAGVQLRGGPGGARAGSAVGDEARARRHPAGAAPGSAARGFTCPTRPTGRWSPRSACSGCFSASWLSRTSDLGHHRGRRRCCSSGCSTGPSSPRAEESERCPTDAHCDGAPHLETSTGLDSRKLAIWTFIGSECMFFATLISNYLVHKGLSLVGPVPPRGVEVADGPGVRADHRDPAGHAGHGAAAVQLAVRGAGAERRAAGEPEGAAAVARRSPSCAASSSSACRCTSSPTSCTRG